MFRGKAARIISKAKVPQPGGISSTANTAAPPTLPSPSICTSLVDGPMFIPGYDFLGKPLDEDDVAKSKSKSVTMTDLEIKATGTNAVATLTTTKPTWLSSLIAPQNGTNAYAVMNINAQPATVKPGFIQRVIYGTADYLLDGAAVTASVKVVKTVQEVPNADGFLHQVLHGVPEHVLDARMASATKVTTVPAVKSEIQKLLDKVQKEEEKVVVETTVTKVTVEAAKSSDENEDADQPKEPKNDNKVNLEDIVDDTVETMAGSVVSSGMLASDLKQPAQVNVSAIVDDAVETMAGSVVAFEMGGSDSKAPAQVSQTEVTFGFMCVSDDAEKKMDEAISDALKKLAGKA